MPQSKDSSKQVAIIVAVLLAVVGGAWVFLNQTGDDTGQTVAVNKKDQISSFPADSQSVRMPVDRALQMAELAFQSGAVVEPEDGSAMYFYLQVLQQEPDNTRAKSGMSLISSQLVDEANDALGKSDYEGAVNKLDWLNRIEPESEAVAAIQESLSAKSEVLFKALDRAIRAKQFNEAEKLARNLRLIPSVDTGRVSGSLVEIAKARKNYKAELERAREQELIDNSNMESMDVVASTRGNNRLDADPQAATTSTAGVQRSNSVQTQPQISAPDVSNPVQASTSEPAVSEPVATEVFEPAPAEVIEPEPVDVISPLLAEAQRRVDNNQLLSPEGDSALHYFQQVLDQDAGNADAKRGLRSLVQALTSDAYKAAERGDWTAAEASLAQADSIGMAESLIAQARSDVKDQRVAAEANKLVNIDEFTPTKTVAPKYPRRAVQRSIEGWVKVSFVVSENGDTENIEVVESSKQYATQFSRAAISAVEQWQFKPRIFDGQAVAGRTETTVQFKLAD